MAKRKEDEGGLFKTPNPSDEKPKEQEIEKEKVNRDCVSAWIKALRLRYLNDSMYWMNIIEQEFGETYLAMRMAIFAGEDCWDPMAMPLASSLQTLRERKTPDIWNHFLYVNWYLCQCPKFWETEGGLAVQRVQMELDTRMKDDPDGKTILEEIPSWACDLHTSIGRDAASAGNWDAVDRRFGGDEVGILTKILMFKTYGRLDPADGFECYWKAVSILKAKKAKAETAE